MKRTDFIQIADRLLKKDKNRKVHITINRNGLFKFYNGTLIDYSDEIMVYFMDDKLDDIDIFFVEILNIEPFKEK